MFNIKIIEIPIENIEYKIAYDEDGSDSYHSRLILSIIYALSIIKFIICVYYIYYYFEF